MPGDYDKETRYHLCCSSLLLTHCRESCKWQPKEVSYSQSWLEHQRCNTPNFSSRQIHFKFV
uniref:Uncharacterized protein n=1 Tax=Arundo donax TaxID=35708 RepID=A0A0A8XPU5_ARUDO